MQYPRTQYPSTSTIDHRVRLRTHSGPLNRTFLGGSLPLTDDDDDDDDDDEEEEDEDEDR
jgi:hypothetical protein